MPWHDILAIQVPLTFEQDNTEAVIFAPGNLHRWKLADLRAGDAPSARAYAHVMTSAPMLFDALLQWKCPGCGGKGTYQQDARGRKKDEEAGRPIDKRFQPDPVVCKVCRGGGLHPIAAEAIANVRRGVES